MAGPISLYLRLVDYKSGALTTGGTMDGNVVSPKDNFDPNSTQFIPVLSCSASAEQTLNIGSQSTGAGAGRIMFNPLSITKNVDGTSPVLFSNAASGTPFKTAELFFVNGQRLILARHTYKMVAVKTVSWSAGVGEESLVEAISFEYGGLFISINQTSPDGGKIINVSQSGWNRIKNVKDPDVNSIIQ